ncbi:MAG: cytochrome P450, partial [Ilumatobacteraceae bacterium]
LDADAVRCPYPHFDAARAEAPVTYVPSIECWVVTRYADIVHIERDPHTFSSIMPTGPVLARQQRDAVGALLSTDPDLAARMGQMRGGTRVLLSADPPDHARQRKLVNRAFTPPKVRDMEPRIREIAHGLVDAFADRGSCDIVPEYGVLLPLTIIAEALGVADDELPRFKRWSDDFVALIGNHDVGREELRSVLLSQFEFFEYFGRKIEDRRAAPGNDLISDLVAAMIDEEPLTNDEILSMLNQFLVAGNETTTKLITSSVRLLLEHPDELARLRADPSRIAGFVEESLRLESPVQGLYRTATGDTEVGGVAIKAGQHLMLVFAAGNRDAERFARPAQIDPCRSGLMTHLAFGQGEHFCLGAALARAEGRIAIEVLLERLDDLRPAAGVDLAALEYERSYVLHGLRSLPVAFTPKGAEPSDEPLAASR